ncbi:MAG: DNA ligase [Oscillospiraceae bacterium]|nr:DNA ligase [Oscillospiraceae bacterium]
MISFDDKAISPMLIASEGEPFDDPAWQFELKLDGERCLAWLCTEGTELRNKRHILLNPKVPELCKLHKQACGQCILDGELFVMQDGAPNFGLIQRRSLLSDPLKVQLHARQHPATFCAFDVLLYNGKDLTNRPLHERRRVLEKAFHENERLALSRVVTGQGAALFAQTKARGLEGVVAKRLDSGYKPGVRTKDWLKIKNLLDDDFVILGVERKEDGMSSLALGQFDGGALLPCGHVTLGVRRTEFGRIAREPAGTLVCTVQFMARNARGGLRQPVFKGLRGDKAPEACVRRN